MDAPNPIEKMLGGMICMTCIYLIGSAYVLYLSTPPSHVTYCHQHLPLFDVVDEHNKLYT
jgi:hypothetical protein